MSRLRLCSLLARYSAGSEVTKWRGLVPRPIIHYRRAYA